MKRLLLQALAVVVLSLVYLACFAFEVSVRWPLKG